MYKNSRILGLIVMVMTVASMFVSCKQVAYLQPTLNEQLSAAKALDTVSGPACKLLYLCSVVHSDQCDQYLEERIMRNRTVGFNWCPCWHVGEILKDIKAANNYSEKERILNSAGLTENELYYLAIVVYPEAEKCADDFEEGYGNCLTRMNCYFAIKDYWNGEKTLTEVGEDCPCNKTYPWLSSYGAVDTVAVNKVLVQICDPLATTSTTDTSKFQQTSPGCFQENPPSGQVYFYQLYNMGGNLIQSGNFSEQLCVVRPGAPGIYYLKIYNNSGFSETKKVVFN
ncbi:MAG: T9SS type A sorting domain-containing protein [Candidatus Falkowbacteria bacterium]|nr:T9SS type A sorting domain-containing protein [Candidatus Falkowbacteria bacterium]